MSEPLAINPHWREQIQTIGKSAFVRAEMLRLGFYSKLDDSERQVLIDYLDRANPRLRELRKDLHAVRKELAELEDFESILKDIRRSRIERVRTERQERKARREEERAKTAAARQESQRRRPVFLGVGVSDRLTFRGGDLGALLARGLPVVNDLDGLAQLMGIEHRSIRWLTYERAAATVDHYTRFEIPKKSGGHRLISSPKSDLRKAQSWIKCSILDLLNPTAHAMAFRPGLSIVDNATPHLRATIVVRVDLKDFFPSIVFTRVRGFFEALGYNPGMATIFALLCTDAPRVKVRLDGQSFYVATGQRGLPQGACTSPSLANLIASNLDRRLNGLAYKLTPAWTYTRYADDLTFSCAESTGEVGRLLKAVNMIVSDEKFTVNSNKTAVMRAPNRQTITGLVVGNSIRISRKDLRRIRAFLHRCSVSGMDRVSSELGKDALSVARGHMAYLQMIMPEKVHQFRRQFPWL